MVIWSIFVLEFVIPMTNGSLKLKKDYHSWKESVKLNYIMEKQISLKSILEMSAEATLVKLLIWLSIPSLQCLNTQDNLHLNKKLIPHWSNHSWSKTCQLKLKRENERHKFILYSLFILNYQRINIAFNLINIF